MVVDIVVVDIVVIVDIVANANDQETTQVIVSKAGVVENSSIHEARKYREVKYLMYSERTTSAASPNVLFIIVILTVNLNFISDKISGVKTYTELSNHTNVSTGRQGLHEGFSS